MTFIFIILIGFVVYIVTTYNKLQRFGQSLKSKNSQVLIAMRKKVDLINQLIDVTKEYGNHEKLIHLDTSDNLKEMAQNSNSTLTNILAISQNFPNLKANEAYINLMNNITNVENDLQSKRESYNHSVENYNTAILSIPVVFFASTLGFNKAEYYDFDNLDSIKEFKTDDGELLKSLLNKKFEQAKELGGKAKEFGQKTFEKYKNQNENNNQETNNADEDSEKENNS